MILYHIIKTSIATLIFCQAGVFWMKVNRIMVILIIFAWPLYYLYERELGAISFLLLAIFFLYISIIEIKKLKQENSLNGDQSPRQKIE